MRVKHPSMVNAELNVGGVVINSDEHGVFDVSEDIGKRLMSLPGYHKPRETEELRAAYTNLKKLLTLKEQVDAKLMQAKQDVVVANQKADRGEGTEIGDEDSEPVTDETPVMPENGRKPTRQPSNALNAIKEAELEEEDDSDEGDGEDEEEDEEPVDTQALLLKYKTAKPTMQWKLNDLIQYAIAKGVAAETGWTKAQVIQELEAQEDE